jgi:FkbM family methyltransferase
MVLNLSLGGIHRHLFLYGCLEPECTRIYSEMIPEGARIVSIGANIGYYVLLEARASSKVYAIEPSPQNVALLRRNIALNQYEDRVEIHELAISDRTGKALLSVSGAPHHHRLLGSTEPQHEEDCIEVEITTLDEFLKDKEVDVINMDIEGAEWLAVNGMKSLVSRKNPLHLFLEVHPELIRHYGGNEHKMLDLLSGFGFRISHIVFFDYQPSVTHPFSSYFKVQVPPHHHAIEFYLPLDIHLMDRDISQRLENLFSYCLFMTRN